MKGDTIMTVIVINPKKPLDDTALNLRGNIILGMVKKILVDRNQCLPVVIDTITNEMKAWCVAIETRKLTENEATFYRYISYIHTALIEFEVTGEIAYLEDLRNAYDLLDNFCRHLYKPDLYDRPLYPDMMPVINRAEDDDIRDIIEDYI